MLGDSPWRTRFYRPRGSSRDDLFDGTLAQIIAWSSTNDVEEPLHCFWFYHFVWKAWEVYRSGSKHKTDVDKEMSAARDKIRRMKNTAREKVKGLTGIMPSDPGHDTSFVAPLLLLEEDRQRVRSHWLFTAQRLTDAQIRAFLEDASLKLEIGTSV